jgi:hypothetical protein
MSTKSTITGANFLGPVLIELGLPALARFPPEECIPLARPQALVGERLVGSMIVVRFPTEVSLATVTAKVFRKRSEVLEPATLATTYASENRLQIEIPETFRGFILIEDSSNSTWRVLSGSRRKFQWISQRAAIHQLGDLATFPSPKPSHDAWASHEKNLTRLDTKDFWPQLKKMSPVVHARALVLSALGLRFDCTPARAAENLGGTFPESVERVWPRLWRRWCRAQSLEERVWTVRTIPPDQFT